MQHVDALRAIVDVFEQLPDLVLGDEPADDQKPSERKWTYWSMVTAVDIIGSP
jgi:hypothetical protein